MLVKKEKDSPHPLTRGKLLQGSPYKIVWIKFYSVSELNNDTDTLINYCELVIKYWFHKG